MTAARPQGALQGTGRAQCRLVFVLARPRAAQPDTAPAFWLFEVSPLLPEPTSQP